MAVTIAETSGHVTETELKSPLSPPVTMHRNDRSHSPKYAAMGKDAALKILGKRFAHEGLGGVVVALAVELTRAGQL